MKYDIEEHVWIPFSKYFDQIFYRELLFIKDFHIIACFFSLTFYIILFIT